MNKLIPTFLLLCLCGNIKASNLKSNRDFNVNSGNSASLNHINLQKAFHWAAESAAASFNLALNIVPEYKLWDYMLIKGNKKLTVTIIDCRMRNYISEIPITIENKNAAVQVVAVIFRNENLYNYVFSP